MYQKILVPLDGSELAECVLPHVEAIAKGCKAGSVIFLRVAEPIDMRGGTSSMFTEEEIKRINSQHQAAAEEYLGQLVNRVSFKGVNVKAEVITGKAAAEAIADYATKNKVDLIIIATHGRSGVSRWVWGSVAERILHSARVPVLMVRAPGA
jgi:nucleotide-binding universal stress UspA family protein